LVRRVSVDPSCVILRKVVAQESTPWMQCIRAKRLAGCYTRINQHLLQLLADAANVGCDVTCLDAHTTRLYPAAASIQTSETYFRLEEEAAHRAMDDAEYAVIRRHLPKLLSSEQMEKSEASQKLLRYLAERAVRGETPKETDIALDVFGRDASFNSAEDSLVRVGVRALRRRLHDYYADGGQHDEMQFVIPKGGYRLICVPREAA